VNGVAVTDPADAELLAALKRTAERAAALEAQVAAQQMTIDTLYSVVVSLDDFRAKLRLPFVSYRILLALIRRSPAVVAQEELFRCVWGETLILSENLLRVHMKRLRDVLAMHGVEIETIHFVGYRLAPEALQRLKQLGFGARGGVAP
jgi:DNA-binding response OmpR family regulator